MNLYVELKFRPRNFGNRGYLELDLFNQETFLTDIANIVYNICSFCSEVRLTVDDGCFAFIVYPDLSNFINEDNL